MSFDCCDELHPEKKKTLCICISSGGSLQVIIHFSIFVVGWCVFSQKKIRFFSFLTLTPFVFFEASFFLQRRLEIAAWVTVHTSTYKLLQLRAHTMCV